MVYSNHSRSFTDLQSTAISSSLASERGDEPTSHSGALTGPHQLGTLLLKL
jgi:hypothetical protein